MWDEKGVMTGVKKTLMETAGDGARIRGGDRGDWGLDVELKIRRSWMEEPGRDGGVWWS